MWAYLMPKKKASKAPGAQELTRPSCPTEFIIIVIILTLFYSKNIYMVIMSSMSC